MIMEMTNAEMVLRIDQLSKYLDHVDIIGYAAARNIRRLQDASLEYTKRRDEVLTKYGEVELDENGRDTGRRYVTNNSPHFQEVNDILTPIGEIKHEVDIFTIEYSLLNGVLSGSDILELDWMLVE